MNNKKVFIIAGSLLALLIFSHIKDIYSNWDAITTGVLREEQLLQKEAQEENICIVSDQQGLRNKKYSYYTIGNKYVFFSYREDSVVDAYNHNGLYQFTIIVPNYQNGSVSIRCDGDLLYISSKQDFVYIFDGTEQIDCLTDDEAKLAGYTWRWFDNQPGLVKDEDYIYLKDDNGKVLLQATIPKTVKTA